MGEPGLVGLSNRGGFIGFPATASNALSSFSISGGMFSSSGALGLPDCMFSCSNNACSSASSSALIALSPEAKNASRLGVLLAELDEVLEELAVALLATFVLLFSVLPISRVISGSVSMFFDSLTVVLVMECSTTPSVMGSPTLNNLAGSPSTDKITKPSVPGSCAKMPPILKRAGFMGSASAGADATGVTAVLGVEVGLVTKCFPPSAAVSVCVLLRNMRTSLPATLA